jgi:hypothetical protein
MKRTARNILSRYGGQKDIAALGAREINISW